jgi:hypothetical protein
MLFRGKRGRGILQRCQYLPYCIALNWFMNNELETILEESAEI